MIADMMADSSLYSLRGFTMHEEEYMNVCSETIKESTRYYLVR